MVIIQQDLVVTTAAAEIVGDDEISSRNEDRCHYSIYRRVHIKQNNDHDRKSLTFAACELKPPMLPAMADPTRFLEMLHSTIWSTVVLRTDDTVFAESTASACAEFRENDGTGTNVVPAKVPFLVGEERTHSF